MTHTSHRNISQPLLVCSPRASLGSDGSPVVDSVLKQLKACSRRLQAALASHRTELQVLERLYYKGKNQHRTALFWRRVAEMRKLGERVDQMHMDDVVESLRLAFWGEPSRRTVKSLKGPWTHYPDVKPVLFVLERCSACCTLLDKTRERLIGAYESFTLMMQTGAFLQLVLVLASLASRMSILLSEVRAALEISWAVSYKFLQVTSPLEAQKVKKLINVAEGEASSSSLATPMPGSQTASGVATPSEVHDEDLGSTLLRPIGPAASAVTDKSVSIIRDDNPLDIAAFSLLNELQTDKPTASQSVAERIPAAMIRPPSIQMMKRKKVAGDSSKPTKKKKRDEIDDIFGF